MSSKIRLLPLIPEFDREQHQVYVDVIEDALSSPEKAIKNIALTGGYGVGKSSILKQVAKVHKGKSLQISLSTLGLPDGDGGGDKSDQTPTGRIQPTNRIQKEIVKQLVYGEEPYKMPGSRFRRIAKLKPWRVLGAAVPGGFALTLVFYLAGWTDSLATLFHANGLGLWFQSIVLVVLTVGAEVLLALLHNRLTIRGLKVASTEIALGKNDTTYFDKFLDEIVYVFQVTDYDIIIFEDIDRFDDPHIFETLRALNILLNGAKQLKGRKIRFIYAIKDSIFEQLGQRAAAEEGISEAVDSFTGDLIIDEVARANRTKFFDIVIPVVPFITHTNARDLTTRILKDITPAISTELIDLAARHLPDMRLIKNVRNEFLIFRSKIFEAGVDLSQDELFAMMLYKNTHLLDFELIRTGQSKLDDLYRGSRELVRINLERLAREASELSQQVSKISSTASRGKILGVALMAYIDNLLVSLGSNQPQQWQITLQGVAYDRSAIQSDAFWQSVAAIPASEHLTVPIALPTGYRGLFSIDKEQLATHVNDSLSTSEWDSKEKSKVERELEINRTDQALLLSASFESLYREAKFQDREKRTFSDMVASLKSELARQLVASGFLSRNFVLYTSTYYGELVSAHARNFLIQNLERGVMDVDYELSDSDVDALIRERGEGVLHEQSFYNVSVLDHLLASDKQRAAIFVKSLQRMTDSEQRLIGAYISSGKKVDDLVSMMAANWSGTLMFVVERDDLEEARKVSLLNTAISNVKSLVDFAPDDNFRGFVTVHASEFGSFSAVATSTKQAQIIAAILAQASVRLPVLSSLSPTVCQAVVEANCYRITIENLEIATDSSDLSLDQLKDGRQPIYDYVLENLGEYLDAIEREK